MSRGLGSRPFVVMQRSDFRGVAAQLKTEAKKIPAKIKKEAATFAQLLVREVKKRIRELGRVVLPLSEDYLQWKQLHGYAKETFERSGGYLESIRMWQVGSKYVVGPYGADPQSGVSYQTIAKWLEEGTSRMPARPHWRPTRAWAVREARRVLLRVLSKLRKGG